MLLNQWRSTRVLGRWLMLCGLAAAAARGTESAGEPFKNDVTFVLPVANFEPVPFNLDEDGNVHPSPPGLPPAPSQPPSIEHGYPLEEQIVTPDYDASTCESRPGLPLGGQYPDNWLDRCGGSPYRNGPGLFDDWKVGPVWDVSVDGMVLWRDRIDLDNLERAALGVELDQPLPMDGRADQRTQFGYGGGGRVYAMGKLPRWPGYQVQFGYEGIPAWNASLLYPKIAVDADGMVDPTSDIDQIRQVHYRSDFHSAEMNFFRRPPQAFRPYWGFRYVRFGDVITDSTDQTAPFPQPVEMPDAGDIVTVQDMTRFINIRNNLAGFQAGMRHDLWHIRRWLTLQGFVNGGVYYNRIQFADGMRNTTTSFIPDDISTTDENEARTLSSSTGLVSSSNPTEISYLAEASITAVCRLNPTLALRGGYQLVWIDNLALAEDVYLGNELGRHNFVLQGWHVGIEYRR